MIILLVGGKFEFSLRKGEDEKSLKTELDELSNTELEILKLVSNGMTNQEIADSQHISVHTVKKHISNIFRKLRIKSRHEARKYKNLIDS